MKRAFLIILLWTLSLTGYSQAPCPTFSRDYIPKDLTDALDYLNCKWSNKDKKGFKKLKEDELFEFHFGSGLAMRNNWGLWQGENDLVKYFNEIGIYHPDDMSSIILLSFHRKLNDKELRLEEQAAYYKSYWEEANKQEEKFKIKTDSIYKSFHKGDAIKVYFHLDNTGLKPRIYLIWAFNSIEELKAKNEPFCEIKGIVMNEPKIEYSKPTLNIRIKDLCGFNEVHFGENEILKTGEILDFEVYPNRLFEKIN